MKRFLISTVVAASLAGAFLPAHAADVSSQFSVSVALVAICTADNSGTQTLDFGAYTAFGAATTPAPTANLTFTCTRGLTAPTFSFDSAGGGAFGVIAGLNYTLSAANAANVTTGSAATAVSGGVGSADVRKVTVTGGMASGQPGTCANTAAGCSAVVTQTRTLTVTY